MSQDDKRLGSSSKSRRWPFVLALIAVLIAGAIVFRSQPAERLVLKRYASPALDKDGTRFRILAPANWRARKVDWTGPPGGLRLFARHGPMTLSRWPAWLQRFLPLSREEATLIVVIRPPNPADPTNARIGRSVDKSDTGGRVHLAWRSILSSNKKHDAMVIYSRENQAAFNNSYESICNSLAEE